jgi:hypothetical protein
MIGLIYVAGEMVFEESRRIMRNAFLGSFRLGDFLRRGSLEENLWKSF